MDGELELSKIYQGAHFWELTPVNFGSMKTIPVERYWQNLKKIDSRAKGTLKYLHIILNHVIPVRTDSTAIFVFYLSTAKMSTH